MPPKAPAKRGPRAAKKVHAPPVKLIPAEDVKELKDYRHSGPRDYFHLCVLLKERQQLPDDCIATIKEQIGERTDVILHFLVGVKHQHEPLRQFCIQNGYRFKSWSYSDGGGSMTDKCVGHKTPQDAEALMLQTLKGRVVGAIFYPQ